MIRLLTFLLFFTLAASASADLRQRMQAEADASGAMLLAEKDRQAIIEMLPRLSHDSLRKLRKTAEDLQRQEARKP
jgi:hypothetical protein